MDKYLPHNFFGLITITSSSVSATATAAIEEQVIIRAYSAERKTGLAESTVRQATYGAWVDGLGNQPIKLTISEIGGSDDPRPFEKLPGVGECISKAIQMVSNRL